MRSLAARAAWQMMRASRMITTRGKPASRMETMTKPSCTIAPLFRALGNPEHVTPWSRCAGKVSSLKHYASPGLGHWDTFQPGNKRRMITREKKNTGNCLHFNTLCCNMHFVQRCKTHFLRLYTFFAQWCIHPFSDFKSRGIVITIQTSKRELWSKNSHSWLQNLWAPLTSSSVWMS